MSSVRTRLSTLWHKVGTRQFAAFILIVVVALFAVAQVQRSADQHVIHTLQKQVQVINRYIGAKQGPPGVPGKSIALPGHTGKTGRHGAHGSKGAQGSQGLAGAIGLPGARGSAGLRGPAGPRGAQGPRGLRGAQGAQGVQGLKGVPGVGPSVGQVAAFLCSGNGNAVTHALCASVGL